MKKRRTERGVCPCTAMLKWQVESSLIDTSTKHLKDGCGWDRIRLFTELSQLSSVVANCTCTTDCVHRSVRVCYAHTCVAADRAASNIFFHEYSLSNIITVRIFSQAPHRTTKRLSKTQLRTWVCNSHWFMNMSEGIWSVYQSLQQASPYLYDILMLVLTLYKKNIMLIRLSQVKCLFISLWLE